MLEVCAYSTDVFNDILSLPIGDSYWTKLLTKLVFLRYPGFHRSLILLLLSGVAR